ncbi:hypothetical protein [Leucobacter musarum]|uniref:hypothetical protein n=1 Tax=Leucobacter musarum TaxID=1930747 RepID=UPI000AC8BEAF|nr:hypothetical protein [Leucobacter musarum]
MQYIVERRQVPGVGTVTATFRIVTAGISSADRTLLDAKLDGGTLAAFRDLPAIKRIFSAK